MSEALRLGAKEPEVKRLQERLALRGFQPGRTDGLFGARTEAALLAFQRAQGLLPDGVYGPRTKLRLDPASVIRKAEPLLFITADLVAAMFPATPVGTIARFLPMILAALKAAGLGDKPMLLTALATIRAESEGFAPIAEQVSRFNTSPNGAPFDLYDHRADLGNRGRPDGERYRGRGFVQLTGRANYTQIGKALGLGLQLVQEPARALEPEIAARILAAFLKPHERAIKEAVLDGDLVRIRRIVNGGTHGLDRFTDAFLRGYRLLEDPVWPSGALDAALAARPDLRRA
ncbi:MAG TPA: peptidoglycan-binding protein [Geminicoccus sp.]|uniref:peptidoglycan-binding protein n=1 Tax=Geminicoccus sp. TaxID=2024832 RepID=UPI002E34BE2C|nr:peptidoglycan-binding protein [Geminicoccus sp.]HEX2529293.1 peptidoglycan-binding protein [Geminicoccus sp.]